MCDLNLAFVSDDFEVESDNGVESTTCVKSAVGCSESQERDLASKLSLNRANDANVCVWETCYPMNSNAMEKCHLDEAHSAKPLNPPKKKTDVKHTVKRRAKNKRKTSKQCSSEKASFDDGNDCVLLKAELESQDANALSGISSITCGIKESGENIIDNDNISVEFEVEPVKDAFASDDDMHNLQSVPVRKANLPAFPDKNIKPKSSDENKNILNNISYEEDYQENVEVLQSNTLVYNCQDCSVFLPSVSSKTVEGKMICIQPAAVHPLSSRFEDDICADYQQSKAVVRRNGRRKSQCIKAGSFDDESHIYGEPHHLSAAEEHAQCAHSATMQGILLSNVLQQHF